MSTWTSRSLTELRSLYPVHRHLLVPPPSPIPNNAPKLALVVALALSAMVLLAGLFGAG